MRSGSIAFSLLCSITSRGSRQGTRVSPETVCAPGRGLRRVFTFVIAMADTQSLHARRYNAIRVQSAPVGNRACLSLSTTTTMPHLPTSPLGSRRARSRTPLLAPLAHARGVSQARWPLSSTAPPSQLPPTPVTTVSSRVSRHRQHQFPPLPTPHHLQGAHAWGKSLTGHHHRLRILCVLSLRLLQRQTPTTPRLHVRTPASKRSCRLQKTVT
jgi:hypothetical protein